MGLKLNTASSGSVTIEPTNTASNYTLTVPAQTGTVVATDASGNVGIGTSSPSSYAKLAVVSPDNNGYTNVVTALSNNLGQTTSLTFAGLRAGSGSGIGFYVNGSTSSSANIDTSGNLLVGTTSVQQSSQLTVAGYIATNGITSHAGTGGAYGTNRFNLQWTGSPALWVDTTNIGNIQLSSDYRIKRNIQTQTIPALERVMALRPVTYQMADYGTLFKASEDIKEGFIAHEVQEVIPSGADGVKDAENQIQSLRVDAILAVAVKAIQEQQAIITELKARVEALENK